ncbi:MAG: helix-turn-helix transcriptional regulator [Shimia sp.]
MRLRILFGTIVTVQVVGMLVYLSRTFSALLGIPPVPWVVYEVVEVAAAVCLILGTGMGIALLTRLFRRNRAVEEQLQVASGALSDLIDARFAEWQLTPAERDVALFAIKGLSLQEIAEMRQTSAGTVKAQTAAIYRKAGVSGRPQLIAHFVEDLMEPIVAQAAPVSPKP